MYIASCLYKINARATNLFYSNYIGYVPEPAITTLIIERRIKILILKASSIFLVNSIS